MKNRLENFSIVDIAKSGDDGIFDAGLVDNGVPNCMKGIKYDVYGKPYHDNGDLIADIRRRQSQEFLENFIEENFSGGFEEVKLEGGFWN